ncbi:preprotein translocase subunit SecY [Actinomadura sp. LD22]|uniref:Protein translocase subunit SecY n=1 Tax=Actinomadura physcomitrii TaxID=2650748 RepID=A0A6I4MW51_9ACTN|nr:preprotein translocase subunit SecY [Actinomadura physcomitrii]MWA07511.1 preprotein translocase subunit SecY [Actinomadura physcomitrii]
MLTAFTRAFRTPDLRKKLLFTLFMILVFRIGATLPAPNVNVSVLKSTADAAKKSNQLYGLVDLFSGGALLKLSVFALGIMPYITASIILQLLTVVIPRLEALKKEGQAGTTKITQYTRYLTVGLAILQATGIVAMASTGQLFQGQSGTDDILYDTGVFPIVTMVICMVAGTTVIMWLGELVTDRGVGNGMSILIFTQVVAVFPSQFWSIYKAKNGFVFALVIIVGLAIMAGVVFVEQAQRRIPVQYAKRMVGRRMYGGTSTYIPLKVNQAGIIPVIFASSLLYLPVLATQLWPNTKWLQKIQPYLQQDNAWHMGIFFVFIIFFTYFYVAITFNPTEVADNMKKYGGFIPGIRPGRPTAEYLDYVLTRITTPGALYLGLVALIPMVAFALLNATQNFPFGGTSILIVVGVGLDTVKQIESQLQQRNYEGFLR